ncbi:2,4-dienoyl-CoA reductase [Halogranum gelatinilyticum]|uniref:2,4-dienoyl-CoA reductase n=1 Tax=Halogranum gelatinilyticum TaxID=660521 RepID=A0A1G9NV34_9EURY|nr:NADH:flavin oxidoreductase [Halogranum gelatinilyticum]SDL90462.1 2,4-dienoyl-CoA reductase [Halogranum gelatinilyticum]
MTETPDDVLFESFDFGGVSLDNRVGLAPMTRTSATDDGLATEEMVRYYAKFARGGFSFLITEGVYTDFQYSQGYLNQPGLVSDEQIEAWTRVTDAVHEEGAPIFAQLMHAGAISQGNPHADETAGPSTVQPVGEQSPLYGGEGEFPTPKELTLDDLDVAKAGFVDAAENALEAGFDGVELHGANGYLLNEFLAADANQREDEYGGDIESRVRFPREVLGAVREAMPDDFVVGIRISQEKANDDAYEWPGGENDAEVVFSELSAAGADYIHVTETDITAPAFGDAGPTLADLAVEYSDTAVIANGGLGDPDAARQAVENGADLVTLGTSALANPDWPRKVAAGEELADFDFEKTLLPQATISDHEVPDAEAVPSDD